MLFRRPRVDYGQTPYPETPFQKAGQIWDEREGAKIVQAANWRYLAFGCLALAFVSSGALIWRSLQSTVTPYVVEVDELGGVRAVGPAIARYEPTDAQIAHHLANLIENVRALSVDPVVVRQNWLKAYDFTTDKGAMALNDYARANDPFADIGQRSRTVDVASVVRISEDSFQVRWMERTYEHSALSGAAHFTGVLSVILSPPETAEALRKNPLGIYVHALNWTKDLATGEDR